MPGCRAVVFGLIIALSPALVPRTVAQTPAVQSEEIRLQFKDADVADLLLNHYAPLTGKTVLFDSTLQGKISLSVRDPVSREQAARLLERALMLNGYYLIDTADNTVTILTGAKNPRFYGVPVYFDPARLPEGDKIVSLFYRFEQGNAVQATQLLGQYIQLQKPFTSFIFSPDCHGLLITESSQVVRALVLLLKALDVAPAKPEGKRKDE